MDILVQQNLSKKNLIVVDIGFENIKVIEANVLRGKIKVTKSCMIPKSYKYFTGNELSMIKELVGDVMKKIRDEGMRSKEVRIVLPSICTQHKVIEAVAVKEKDLPSYVKNEAGSMLSKAASTINCTDWCVIGSNENVDESTKTCIIASVPRKIAFGLASEFEKLKANVTVMTIPLLSAKNICDLYKADYEHPVKLFVDFGATSIRMIVANAGNITMLREHHVGGHTITSEIYDELSKCVDGKSAKESFSVKAMYDLLENVGTTLLSNSQSESDYDEYSDFSSYNEYGSTENKEENTDVLGGDDFYEKQSNTENSEDAQAYDYLFKYGINPIQYNELMERSYDEIISEVIKTIDLCADGVSKPTEIIYFGRISKVKGFIERLRESVNVPVEELDIERHDTGSGYTVEQSAGVHLTSDFANSLAMCIDILV